MVKRRIYLDTSVISAYFDEKCSERMALTRGAWDIIMSYGVSRIPQKNIVNFGLISH